MSIIIMTDRSRLISDLEDIGSRLDYAARRPDRGSDRQDVIHEIEYLQADIDQLARAVDVYKRELSDINDVIYDISKDRDDAFARLQRNKIRFNEAVENQSSDAVRSGYTGTSRCGKEVAMLDSRIGFQKSELKRLSEESDILDEALLRADHEATQLDIDLKTTDSELAAYDKDIDRLTHQSATRARVSHHDYDKHIQHVYDTHDDIANDLATTERDLTAAIDKLKQMASLCQSIENENLQLRNSMAN